MSLIPFPYVPKLPGVPYLPRLVGRVIPPAVSTGLGLIGSFFGSLMQSQTKWGIYDQNGIPIGGTSSSLWSGVASIFGGPILSTNHVEYRKETKVSDFPTEGGRFATYNKVELPSQPMVALAMSGSESQRSQFLTAIDTAVKTTDLYSVVTPDATYINHTLERYNYSRRTQRGANMLVVEIFLKEARDVSAKYATAKPAINNPKAISAASIIDAGKQQVKQTIQSVENAVIKKVTGLLP